MLIREFGLCNCSTICIEATLPGTRLLARPPIHHMNICLFSSIFVFDCYCVNKDWPPSRGAAPTATSLLFSEVVPSLRSPASSTSPGCVSPLYMLGNFAARARTLFFTYDSSLMSESRLTVLGDANSPHTSQTSQGMFQASHAHLFLLNTVLPAQRLPGDQDLTYLLPRRSCHVCEEGLISAFLMMCFLFSV